MTTETAKAFADSCGLEYRAEFVPQSRSRNAGNKEPCLNWRVTLSKGGRTLSTDYMQGCAHIPHYSHAFARIALYADAVRATCETGKSPLVGGKRNAYDACQGERLISRASALPAPALADILYCLVSDAAALDYPNFGAWCADFGYSEDSREAERIYRACLETALTLRGLLDLDAAREAFQDY